MANASTFQAPLWDANRHKDHRAHGNLTGGAGGQPDRAGRDPGRTHPDSPDKMMDSRTIRNIHINRRLIVQPDRYRWKQAPLTNSQKDVIFTRRQFLDKRGGHAGFYKKCGRVRSETIGRREFARGNANRLRFRRPVYVHVVVHVKFTGTRVACFLRVTRRAMMRRLSARLRFFPEQSENAPPPVLTTAGAHGRLSIMPVAWAIT